MYNKGKTIHEIQNSEVRVRWYGLRHKLRYSRLDLNDKRACRELIHVHLG